MNAIFGFAVAGFKEFILDEVVIGSAAIQNWMFFALAIVAVLVALVIVSAVKNSKRKSAEEDAPSEEEGAVVGSEESAEKEATEETDGVSESAEETSETEEPEEAGEEPEAVEETPVPETYSVANNDAEENESPEEEAVPAEENEKAEEEEASEQAQPEKEEETVATEEAAEEQKTEKNQKTENEEEDTMKEKNATKPEEKKPAAKKATKKEEPEKVTAGKFEICNSSLGGFRYHLLANNGQLLYQSKDYKTYASCSDAIEKFVNSVTNGVFSVKADKFGNYKYHLKSATSNNIIYIGESYTSKKAALNSVESVKRFAPVSSVVDATDDDFEVTATAFDIPDDVKKAVAQKQGAVGKWVVDKVDAEDDDSSYVFLLYANNGQLLFESREYATMASCNKGIETFVSTVEEGYFVIDEDKFGRFKFLLRSNKAGSLAEYVGPFYPDKSSCCGSATSVYKFALLTPVE